MSFKHNVNSTAINIIEKIFIAEIALMLLVAFTVFGLPKIHEQNKITATVLSSEIISLTNKEREKYNVHNLKHNTLLDYAAYLKAIDMKTKGYFDHYSPDGTSPWHWFDVVGYDYEYAGENLAIYFNDTNKVVEAWMQSPSHRENMLKKEYTEIGVATLKGTYNGYETTFIVQMFGSK